MAGDERIEQLVEETAARVGSSVDANLVDGHRLQRLVNHLHLSEYGIESRTTVFSYQLRYPALLCRVLRILESGLRLGLVKQRACVVVQLVKALF